MAGKTIADYSKDYFAAKQRGDAAGMKAANDAANAIRASSGQAAVNASNDIKYTDYANSKGSSGSYGGGGSSGSKPSGSSGSKSSGLSSALAGLSGLLLNPTAAIGGLAAAGVAGAANTIQKNISGSNTGEIFPEVPVVEESPYDPEIADMIKQLRDAQQASRIAGLTSAMNNSLSNLDTQQAGLKDTYYNARNAAGAQSDVGAANFAQYMASRGIKGNAAGMPEIYRNAGLQNQIGALNQQEAQANTGIENQRTALKNAYESDVSAAKADTDSQYLQNMITQMNADRTYQQQQKEYLDSQLQQQKQEYANNIGAYYQDYQAEIDKVQNDGDTGNDWMIPYLQAARNQKLLDQQAKQEAAAQQAAALKTSQDQQDYENALNAFIASGTITSQQQAAILGMKIGDKTADYNIAQLQASLDQQKINLEKAQQASSGGSGGGDKQDTYGAIYSAMMGSADPQQWLNQNAPYMTNDEIKYAQSVLQGLMS